MQTNKQILPSQTIGIIGGGQLGRMMALAAKHMGYRIAVLDPTPDCPTAQVADHTITAAYDDLEAIKELSSVSDVITYEFENVDLTAASYLEKEGKLPQGAYALEITQNREKEKQLMKKAGLPVPEFTIVHNGKECEEALEKFTFPAVLKTCSGGYDGKGQIKLLSKNDAQAAIHFAEENKHCIIEQWVPFDKEISVVFTRSQSGGVTYFPLAENEHKDQILFKTTAPAQVSSELEEKAIEAAGKLAEEMNIVGTFAIEMFVKGNDIYLNEMAPRPHNSGHYTIESCNISQFAQHVRAVCGLPLAKIEQLQPALMVNILGEDIEKAWKVMQENPEPFVHLYGKAEAKIKRKMGHVTFLGKSVEELQANVKHFEEAKQ
ncbi:5-(carboxyamino)imidazole ribonucleotide synthase [Virgibacillus oceani]